MAKGGDQCAGTYGPKRFPMAGRNAVASLKKALPRHGAPGRLRQHGAPEANA